MPASRSCERLVDVGDAEPVRAAGERGAGALHRSVAVGVRLHDSHDVLGADDLAQACDVGCDRVQVDDRLAEGAVRLGPGSVRVSSISRPAP